MKKAASFVVLEFDKFPGVRIPLLSGEECKARGIERPRLPPFETWTPEQQEAGRKLGEILAAIAVKQAYRIILRQLEGLEAAGYSKTDFEKEAARRALVELRTGKWRAGRDDVHGLEEEMGWVLESLLRDEPPQKCHRRRSAPRSNAGKRKAGSDAPHRGRGRSDST